MNKTCERCGTENQYFHETCFKCGWTLGTPFHPETDETFDGVPIYADKRSKDGLQNEKTGEPDQNISFPTPVWATVLLVVIIVVIILAVIGIIILQVDTFYGYGAAAEAAKELKTRTTITVLFGGAFTCIVLGAIRHIVIMQAYIAVRLETLIGESKT